MTDPTAAAPATSAVESAAAAASPLVRGPAAARPDNDGVPTGTSRQSATRLRWLGRVNPLSVGVVMLALGVWVVVSNFVLVDSIALPSPQVIARTFIDLFTNGYGRRSIWEHIGTSMGRALTGFTLAVVCSTIVGLIAGYSAKARSMIMPFIDFIRPVPALALVPLFVFFFGIGSASKIALIFLGAFVYMTLQTCDGVRAIPADLFAAGRNLGFTTAQMFRHVVLPGTLPAVVTGMRTALSLSWALVVAAELIAAPSGLGYIVTDATSFFQIPVVYCAVILLGALGFLMDRIIVAIRARVLHWQGR